MGVLSSLASGFFFGIFIRSFFDFDLAFPALIGVLALAAFALWFVADKERAYLVLSLFCLAMALGIMRYEWKHAPRSPGVVGDQTQALVIDEPDLRENSIRYVAKMGEAKVLIVSRPGHIYSYGDLLSLEGTLQVVDESYLSKDEIYHEVIFPKITFVESGHGNWLRAKLIGVKNWFSDNVEKHVGEPESSLAGGLVLGSKESLGKELLDKFRVAGLVHMVVLSGYNITIVALSIMWFFGKFLSKRTSIVVGVISIILFALMVGAGATVVRASVMAILGLLAQASGRTREVARALVIAALLMVAINPKLLVFDIGFQLSFLATLGLIYLDPIFKPHFTWLPERLLWLPIREIASATLGAQLAVFPLILYTFGNFSLYAFPVNMLVLPLVPTTMLLVFIVGVLVPIPLISLLAYPIAWLTYALLAYIISLVLLVAHLPFASLQFESVPLVFILAIYTTLIFIVLRFHKKEQHLGVKPSSA